MKSIDPDKNKLPEIFANIPDGRPIVMVNLLKFKEVASYRDETKPCSGREAYRTYSLTAIKKVKEVGGQPIWMGNVAGCVIAPDGEDWDDVLLVKYPCIGAFRKMLADPEYQKCTFHRTAALDNARLIATLEADVAE
jgi:uncharacterized protein (DUF1330 family)